MSTTVSEPAADPGTSPRDELTRGTLIAAVVAVGVAQIGLSIPAVLNGLFQLDLSTSSTQLTWISDAFLVPVAIFELTFGVVGDLFGRKRLLAGGAALMTIGCVIAFFTPTSGSTDARIAQLWIGQGLAGLGAAAIFPTSVAMLAAGTHTAKARAHAISVWAAALTAAGFISPVMSGLLAKAHHSGGVDASWRWGFLALAILAAISAAITMVGATNSSAPRGRALDFPGQITIAVALFALLFAVIQGADDGWASATVIGGFVIAVVFLVAFVAVETRVDRPLIQLDLFNNRIFVATAVVTVIAMFAYLGTAYSTSIRLSAIQGYSPLKTSIGFVCLNIMGVVLFPVSARMIERHNPGWTLAGGALAIGIGDLVLAAIPATHLSIAAIAVPLLVVSIGFKLAVTSITVVAVNSVPTDKTGMASGATSMLRDFGLTLGPAIVGAVALSRAANQISAKIAASPALSHAVAAFNAAPAHVPAAQKATVEAAVGAVNSGPLGANGVPATVPGPNGHPMPFNPLKDVSFHALSNAFQVGYLLCGIAAVVAALIAAIFLAGQHHDDHFTEAA
ncbi:MAG TPA: MFS transporter [Micromonosporaceae bacterium]